MGVVNNDIPGKQCNIARYVDDNKVSHVEQDVIDDIIRNVEQRFMGLTVTKGNLNNFLGIKIRHLKNRMIVINMRE